VCKEPKEVNKMTTIAVERLAEIEGCPFKKDLAAVEINTSNGSWETALLSLKVDTKLTSRS